jgi:hypothetical protein
MQLARFVRTVWFPLTLVLIGFAGGCGSGAPPATGPATGQVVNGVPQIDDTEIRAGKRERFGAKGAAKANLKGTAGVSGKG